MRGEAPSPKAGVLAVDPYVPGRSKLEGCGPVIKLSSNETPLGPSPLAVAAYREAAAHLDRYPDGSHTALREALGAAHGLDPARIVCGNGSDELFHVLAAAYLGPGDEAIYTEHGFLVYRIAILAAGATPGCRARAEPDRRRDRDPGPCHAADARRFHREPEQPDRHLSQRGRGAAPQERAAGQRAARPRWGLRRICDGRGLRSPASSWFPARENTIMTRTFSKIYGLAAARVGWAYAPAAVAYAMNQIRSPFNLAGPSMAAAVAALGDTAHIEQAKAHNALWRERVTHELREIGYEVPESSANFVLIPFGAEPGRTAQDADDYLVSKRIIVRQLASYKLPHALRMTIGLEHENRAVIDALREFKNR